MAAAAAAAAAAMQTKLKKPLSQLGPILRAIERERRLFLSRD